VSDTETSLMVSDFFGRAIAKVASLSPDTPLEQLLQTRELCKAIQDRAKELGASIEDATGEYLKANGDFEYGGVRYYYGVSRTKKCRDIRATVEAIFDAAGGDFDVFIQALSSNALKPGACANILDEETFAEHFDVIEKTDVKTGKPKKSVHKVDSRFLK